jgi:hypothetical protein
MPGLVSKSSSKTNSTGSVTNGRKKPQSAGSGDVHQESIYNLIPKVYIAPPRPPRHRSVYAGLAREEYKSSQVKPAGTIGPAEATKVSPKQFLKKHTNEQKKQKGMQYGELISKND